jgi:hypothetical protein
MKMNFLAKWLKATHFEMYPVEEEFLSDLIENSDVYKRALQRNMTDKFYKEEEERLTGKVPSNHNVMYIGPPGKGKSYGMLYNVQYEMELLGKQLIVNKYISFDKTNIQMKLAEIVRETVGTSIDKYLNSGKPVRIKISMGLDEDVKKTGKGSNIERQSLINIEKVVRQAQICFNYCSPVLESHIYTTVLDFFAINFEQNMNVAWLLHPISMNPIGIVFMGMASDNIIKAYEMEKSKFLFKVGQGQFGEGRIDLKKEVANDVIKEHYDEMRDCTFKRQQMLIIEETAAGRLSNDEQKDCYEIMIRTNPELDRRAGTTIKTKRSMRQ